MKWGSGSAHGKGDLPGGALLDLHKCLAVTVLRSSVPAVSELL